MALEAPENTWKCLIPPDPHKAQEQRKMHFFWGGGVRRGNHDEFDDYGGFGLGGHPP